MKTNNVSGKTLTKNQRLFHELCIAHPERFLLPLEEIRKLFGLPKIKEIAVATQVLGDKPTEEDWNRLLGLITQFKTNRLKFFESLDEGERNGFYNRIDRILIDNKLGIEWRCPLFDFVISGLLMPPIYNLGIQSDKEHKILNLILNPSTSFYDIKTAWGTIEKEKIKVFGKVSRRNLSKKSIENMVTLAKAENIQKHNPKLKGTGLIAELYPVLDNEELPDITTDKKSANNLRQIKSRFNRKV